MSSFDQRRQVFDFARSDFDRAYLAARKINAPRYRCQALAAVLRHAPESERATLTEEAFAAASECKDAYQQVSASSWVLRALIETGETRRAARYLPVILTVARNITPSPSEVEALFLLWNAVWIARTLRQPASNLLLDTCERANTWRAGRAMHSIVLIVAGENGVAAERVWERMPENRYKRKARRDLDAGKTESVRGFFRP